MPDASTLLSNSSCYQCFGANAADAIELSLLASAAQNGISFGYDPAVTNWVARVIANGGPEPSTNTKRAANTFWLAMKAASIDGQIKVLNFVAPDSLIASLTPFIQGPGFSLWTNNGFVAGDLTVNGLKGDGIAKSANTGVTPNAFMSNGNMSAALYISENFADRNEVEMGLALASGKLRAYVFSGVLRVTDFDDTLDGAVPEPLFRGYFLGTKEAINNRSIYAANSVLPHAQIYHSVATDGGGMNVPASHTVIFLASDEGSGNPNNWSAKRISFMMLGTAFKAADSLLLYNAVTTLRNSLGGGTF